MELTNEARAVRLLAYAEGLSLLVLLFLAMPVKYMLEQPILVKWVGPVHGMLFLLYVAAIILARESLRWTWGRVVLATGAASVPFASFFPHFHAPSKRDQTPR